MRKKSGAHPIILVACYGICSDMQQGAVVPLANFQQDPLHNLSHLFFLAHLISLILSSYATRFPLHPFATYVGKMWKNQDLWYCLPPSIFSFAAHSPGLTSWKQVLPQASGIRDLPLRGWDMFVDMYIFGLEQNVYSLPCSKFAVCEYWNLLKRNYIT